MNQLRKRSTRANQPYVPSPGAIRQECEQIQGRWSERERRVDMSAVTEAICEDFGNGLPPHGASANDWDR
jgi:hypothetical protein